MLSAIYTHQALELHYQSENYKNIDTLTDQLDHNPVYESFLQSKGFFPIPEATTVIGAVAATTQSISITGKITKRAVTIQESFETIPQTLYTMQGEYLVYKTSLKHIRAWIESVRTQELSGRPEDS